MRAHPTTRALKIERGGGGGGIKKVKRKRIRMWASLFELPVSSQWLDVGGSPNPGCSRLSRGPLRRAISFSVQNAPRPAKASDFLESSPARPPRTHSSNSAEGVSSSPDASIKESLPDPGNPATSPRVNARNAPQESSGQGADCHKGATTRITARTSSDQQAQPPRTPRSPHTICQTARRLPPRHEESQGCSPPGSREPLPPNSIDDARLAAYCR